LKRASDARAVGPAAITGSGPVHSPGFFFEGPKKKPDSPINIVYEASVN
jgi:hypothetical protein